MVILVLKHITPVKPARLIKRDYHIKKNLRVDFISACLKSTFVSINSKLTREKHSSINPQKTVSFLPEIFHETEMAVLIGKPLGRDSTEADCLAAVDGLAVGYEMGGIPGSFFVRDNIGRM